MIDPTTVRRADVCALAVADCFRGDGELLANPIGTTPMIGGRLARATFEPHLVMTDGEALLVADHRAVLPKTEGKGPPSATWATAGKTVESWNPYRSMFDVVWSGRRHVIMGASQIDRHGNQNFAAIGTDYAKPKAQLLGFRGAPGNTANDTTSYWIPNHSPQVFVERVDVVCGIGYDRAAALPEATRRFHELRRVVTNLAVLDFGATDDDGIACLHLRSVHPGVTVDEVVAATGCALVVDTEVPTTPTPTADDIRILDDVIDPGGARYIEVREETEIDGKP